MTKGKLFLIIGLLILLIGVPVGVVLLTKTVPFRLGAKGSEEPENVRALEITEQSARIAWTTEKPTQGLINYGLDVNNLALIQPETAPAVNHQLTLSRLLSGRTYYFVIKVKEKTFTDKNGQPYSFTTRTGQPTLTPTPLSSPLTEADLEAVMGTNNSTYDLNQDGIVNYLDLQLFRQRKQ